MGEATARIVALHYAPRRREPMRSVQSIQARQDHGLDGDSHARPGGQRQVLLLDVETLRVLDLPPGSLKENITTELLAVSDLKAGDLIRAGDVAFQITMECEPCAQVDELRPGLRKEVEGRRGLLAKVVKGGDLYVGQPLTVEKVAQSVQLHPAY